MIERNCSGSIPTVPTDYLDSEAARAKYPLLVHVKESLRTLEDCLDESYESLAFNNPLLHMSWKSACIQPLNAYESLAYTFTPLCLAQLKI